MELKHVRIQNFRTCNNVSIEVGPYNPIVGYNNAGKSNCLKAISWLLKKFSLNESFFGDPAIEVSVEGIISNISASLSLLPHNQQQQISPYVQNDALTFRRRQEVPGTAASLVKLEVLNAQGTWAPNPTGIDNALGALFPEPVYIRAMDDAGDDVAKFGAKNTIGLLLKYAIDLAKVNNIPAMAAVDAALQSLGSHLNGPGRISELDSLELNAAQSISSFFTGLGLVIDIPPPNIEEIIKSANVRITDSSGTPRSFSDYGHGTQRTVQMALIQLLAKYSNAGQSQGSVTAILIDEPELYLHPQAIGLVKHALKQLSQNDFQVFFSTHSPLMVDAEDAIDTAVFWKCPTQGTQHRPRVRTALAGISNSQHQTDVLFSLKHSSQWLFSEHPIIVEGKTERFLLPDLYRIAKGSTLSADSFALIESSGSGSTMQIADLLSNLGYTPKTILDLDFAFKLAVTKGLLQQSDQNLVACRAWFAANSSVQNFALDPQGLPMKGIPGTAGLKPEHVYELLAQAMPQECTNLHLALRNNNIWLWYKGAIEAHLGIPKKNDSATANFIAMANANGNVNHAADPTSITDLIAWL